jgi:hypothetical protein
MTVIWYGRLDGGHDHVKLLCFPGNMLKRKFDLPKQVSTVRWKNPILFPYNAGMVVHGFFSARKD